MTDKPNPSDNRLALRRSMHIPESALVALVIYEPQTEHLFRTYWPQLSQRYHYVLVLPYGPRASEIYRATFPFSPSNFITVDGLNSAEAADEVLAFRFLEELFKTAKIFGRVIDPQNRWLTKELS